MDTGGARFVISPRKSAGGGKSEVGIQRHSQVCRHLHRGPREARESRRGAVVFGFSASIVREAASREPVTGGIADSDGSARDFGRTTTNPEAKYGAASCTGSRAVIFFSLFAPAKAGKKQFLQKDWTKSVGANAFFSFEYFRTFRRSRPSGQPPSPVVRLGLPAVNLGVVREVYVLTSACTELAPLPFDLGYHATLTVPTPSPAHVIVQVH